jgi:aspartate/methionine/tyrosine aminotransferase
MDMPMNRRLLQVRPSGIRQFTALARSTPGCISLALGEPEFTTPEAIRAQAEISLDLGRTHYPPNNGEPFLLEAISRYEGVRHGLVCSPGEIIVTVGATEALYIALTGILNPGDQVIIPTPAFCLYQEITTLVGGVCRFLDTSRTGFQITPDALAPLLNQKTRAILLTSPNNPTGAVLDSGSLEAVRQAVSGKPIFVICDEVYRELVYTPDFPSLGGDPGLRPQLILVRSFSKPYAMTGWRAGWLLADAPVKAQLQKLHQYSVVSAASFIQTACVRALREDISPVVERYRQRRDYACRRLEAMGLPTRQPDGAFYLFPSISRWGLDSQTFCTRLIREGGVGLVPGTCFGCEGFVRISYCCSQDTLAAGLDRLEAFLERLRGEQPPR